MSKKKNNSFVFDASDEDVAIANLAGRDAVKELNKILHNLGDAENSKALFVFNLTYDIFNQLLASIHPNHKQKIYDVICKRIKAVHSVK